MGRVHHRPAKKPAPVQWPVLAGDWLKRLRDAGTLGGLVPFLERRLTLQPADDERALPARHWISSSRPSAGSSWPRPARLAKPKRSPA